MYKSPKSNYQINALIKNNNPSLYYRLCLLFVKFVKKNNYYDFLYHLFRRNKSDQEIFKQIKPFIKNYKPKDIKDIKDSKNPKENTYLNNLATRHVDLLSPFLQNRSEPDKSASNLKYLDFGCGKCDLTEHIGYQLGLSSSSIFGTDIKEEFEPAWEKIRLSNKNITFRYLKDGNIPFDNKFDIITCFMVLHHIKTPEKTIQNIHSSLNVGGLFYIREHNCAKDEDKIFADLVHSLFMLQNDATIEKIQEQEIYYKSAANWKKMISSVGFKEIYFSEDTMSVSNNYKAVYQKI
jgi:2-polyprenyl-3-methyl-5-hydroxy-6-metoxy-1,4-benzoquinol methylase